MTPEGNRTGQGPIGRQPVSEKKAGWIFGELDSLFAAIAFSFWII
jgi:hypothetical protein